MTVMESEAVVDPPVLVAVTVYVAAVASAVGVPLTTPVLVLRLSPAGSDGETEYETTGPPPLLGVLLAMAAPLV